MVFSNPEVRSFIYRPQFVCPMLISGSLALKLTVFPFNYFSYSVNHDFLPLLTTFIMRSEECVSSHLKLTFFHLLNDDFLVCKPRIKELGRPLELDVLLINNSKSAHYFHPLLPFCRFLQVVGTAAQAECTRFSTCIRVLSNA